MAFGVMSRPKRLPTFDYLGPYAYSLTFCVFERHKLFDLEPIVDAVRVEILRTAAEFGFAVLAYCFMPDHLHLLVQGTHKEAALRPFAKRARQRASVATNGMRSHPLWQDGYHERTLRHDEHLLIVATYIANNPFARRSSAIGRNGHKQVERSWTRCGMPEPTVRRPELQFGHPTDAPPPFCGSVAQ
jgi:putative transposase